MRNILAKHIITYALRQKLYPSLFSNVIHNHMDTVILIPMMVFVLNDLQLLPSYNRTKPIFRREITVLNMVTVFVSILLNPDDSVF